MTKARWLLLGGLVVAVLAALAWPQVARPPSPAAREPASGGSLVGTLRSEPTTFNRYTGVGFPTHLVTDLTQARLVRINRATQELEPWLAERWTRSADGLRYTVELRPGVRFSDGHPFTADDVVFSFAAAYDARTASPLGDALRVGGQPIAVRAVSPLQIELAFSEPYGPGLRLIDSLPIYPKHRLGAALDEGTFAKAWGPQTPPADIVGLGPFVLTAYDPGQRLTFARNPHYWRTDAAGHRLPRLDRLTLELVPDQNAELLRLQAGQLDVMQSELRPEDYLPLKRAADAGKVRLLDVGTSLDTYLLWFNLGADDRARPWMQRGEFRRALSHAVDREAFVRTVYLGAAAPSWGLVSPANRSWYSEDVERAAYDPERARTLLGGLGLVPGAEGAGLVDASGATVHFTLLVQKGIAGSEKGAAFLRDAFARVGVRMDVAALDVSAVMGRWAQGDYDAIYQWVSFTDTDPAGNLDFWLSSGSMHLWHPGQKKAATPWEAHIDTLMTAQAAALDLEERQRLFAEVQRTLAEHLPVMSFATPHVFVGTSVRVSGGRPSVQRPQLLWDADEIAVER